MSGHWPGLKQLPKIRGIRSNPHLRKMGKDGVPLRWVSKPSGSSSTSRNGVRLCFLEPDSERTQQFTLHWSADSTSALRPLIRQQWNFSPTGSIIQIEDYEVDLIAVRMLQLIVSPEIHSGPAVATLVSWHIA